MRPGRALEVSAQVAGGGARLRVDPDRPGSAGEVAGSRWGCRAERRPPGGFRENEGARIWDADLGPREQRDDKVGRPVAVPSVAQLHPPYATRWSCGRGRVSSCCPPAGPGKLTPWSCQLPPLSSPPNLGPRSACSRDFFCDPEQSGTHESCCRVTSP